MGSVFGGGSAKQAQASRTPVEDPNNLRSRAVGRVIDVVAEGPCVGLADGLKSVYFDGTPVQNNDGSWNFTGMSIDVRTGTPDQTYVPDFPAVEAEVGVGTQVKLGLPVTRRVDNLTADAIRVTITTPALVLQDTATGDAKGTRVDFRIKLRRAGQSGWSVDNAYAIEGKQTGQYQRQYRLPLPGDGPWDVQVERLTPDSDKATLQNAIYFTAYTEIIDYKLTYPNTGFVASKFHAEQFDSIPKREFDWKGWIVKVPSHYDPFSRAYGAGIWDGSWKMAWTDNPAWILYALLTHPRGANLPESSVDRWGLYQIARYCDEFVDDGYGGREPRFTANGTINTREEAFAVINTLCSVFRGMAYWSAGAVSVVADMPTSPSVIVTPSNTIGGFSYSGVANKARHTACAAAFLDKSNNYERSIEVYEDVEAIEKWGYNLQEITAFATTTRGQAMRMAKWLVDTEVHAGDSLTYKASLDHLNVVPGAVVEVQDPTILGFRAGGRINHSTPSVLNLDDTVTLKPGITYRAKIVMPDLSVLERAVTNGPGATASLTLTPPLFGAPLPGAEWLLLQANISNSRQFRVIGVTEDDGLEYTIAAIEHDPNKYDRVEKGIVFSQPPFSTLPNPGIVAPPTNVSVERQYISTGTGWTTALQLSWTASPDAFVSSYRVSYRRDSGNFVTLPEAYGNNVTIYGETSGRFVFHVQAINYASVLSRPAVLEITILDTSPITMIRPSGLELEGQGNDNVFSGKDPKFTWRPTALRGAYPLGTEPAAGAGYLDAIFRDYEIRIYSTAGKLIHTDHTGLTWWTFAFEKNAATEGGPHRAFTVNVLMRDRWGNVSLPAELSVINPAPPQPVNLQVAAGLGAIFVSHDAPGDTDFAGDLIWMGETSGFIPAIANVVYDGPSTYNVIPAPQSSTRYIRIASYDVFGKTDLNVSPEFHVDVGGVSDPDFVPPHVPTGLSLSQRSVTAPDGATTYYLRADWNANSDNDFLLYSLAVAEDGGNFVFFTSDQPAYEWIVQPGATYTVKLRAVDRDTNASVYSAEAKLLITPDVAAKPADPAALVVTGTLRVLWLQWPSHPARDWEYMEVWEASTNDRSLAVHIHNATGTTFPRQGLDSGVTRYYWIKAVTRSLAKSEFFPASPTGGIAGTTTQLEGEDFPPGIVRSEFIESLSAIKIEAGTTLSGSVIVDGTSLSGIASAATDPAGRLNRGRDEIDPGVITVSGGTTLADWRYAGDLTQIDGGDIAANTVTANKVTVGLRNVEFAGIAFEPKKELNQLTWTSGIVYLHGDTGAGDSYAISAGSVTYTGPWIYVYWAKAQNQLNTTTDPQIYANPNVIVLAIYTGGVGLSANYGRTVVDGDTIRTGTVHADKLIANTVAARHLSVSEVLIANSFQLGPGTINGLVHIQNGTVYNGHLVDVSFDKLSGGVLGAKYLQVGGVSGSTRSSINIEGRFGQAALRYHDSNNTLRCVMGQPGGSPNPNIDGFAVLASRPVLLHANGFGVNIAGTDQLTNRSVTNLYAVTNSSTLQFVSAPAYQGIGNQGLLSFSTAISNANITPIANYYPFRLLLNGAVIRTLAIPAFSDIPISVPPSTTCTFQIQVLLSGDNANAGWRSLETDFSTAAPYGPWQFTFLEVKR
jgi:predicted phage tail protein